MSLQGVTEFAFEFGDRPIQFDVSRSPLSSDVGLLIFRQMDERLRYTEQFAGALQGDVRADPLRDRSSGHGVPRLQFARPRQSKEALQNRSPAPSSIAH